ncbi:hypothetical protein N9018_02770 [Rhodopirellula sp.]|nr:hypothetical protein [Rhodopirellula sp.]
MCCFSQPIRSVSRTRIFGRLTEQKSQFVAYQMRYKSDYANAMILPIPIQQPSKQRCIRFIDLSGYPQFFDDLDKGFPKSKKLTKSIASESGPAKDRLKVHKVGGFEASFVPTANHFSKLDRRFSIAKDIWKKIPAYSEYGFVVFQLHELDGTPHPMAFDFDTRMTDATFLPTIHIHDGEVHQRENFDHTMYIQNPEIDLAAGDYQGHKLWDLKSGWRRSFAEAEKFIDLERAQGMIAGHLRVHCKIMKGKFANKDQIISRQKLQTDLLGSFAPLAAPISLTLCSAGLGSVWLLNRRGRLMSIAATQENRASNEN